MLGEIVLPDFEVPEGFQLHESDKVARLDRAAEALPIYSIAQRHLRGRVEREWLIENLFPRRAVVILSGWSSVGKTHVANDLMYSVAFDEPFAGFEIKRRCGAMLFAAEGEDDVIPRWDALEFAKIRPWFEHRDLPVDSYYPLYWTDVVPKLTAPDAFDQYSRAIQNAINTQRVALGVNAVGIGLVVIDTMAAAATLLDDAHNSAGPNQTIFDLLHRLAKAFDVCVVVVDHLGKDLTKGTRGSTAKEASADVVLRITGSVSEDGVVSNTAMTVAKLRGGAMGRKLYFNLKTVKLPPAAGKRVEGVVVQWSDIMPVVGQNKRHGQLMKAIDEAILEKFQWVRLDRNMNFKAADSRLIWAKFKLSAAATVETGTARDDSIRKNFNRAMKDSSEKAIIGQKTMSDQSVLVWRTEFKFPDTSKQSD
jgi:hypothetical protein